MVAHNTDISITEMVYSRLPFLQQTENNDTLISRIIVEYMFELEVCFKIDKDNPDSTHIGDEQYYSIIQRSIIADLVAMSILQIQILSNMTGSSSGDITAGEQKFLSAAKAGSVDVQWEQFDVNSSLVIGGEKLLQSFMKSASRKARTLNCLIEICDECDLSIQLMVDSYEKAPFRVVASCPYQNIDDDE